MVSFKNADMESHQLWTSRMVFRINGFIFQQAMCYGFETSVYLLLHLIIGTTDGFTTSNPIMLTK